MIACSGHNLAMPSEPGAEFMKNLASYSSALLL
jgi:hypothetical protein